MQDGNTYGGNVPITCPPQADLRTFNVNDILGELNRDDKGNIVVEKGQDKDNQGHPINVRGYLMDKKSGAILENQNFQTMFNRDELDS